MIPKKDCTKTACPLCESQCQAGSTDSGFIENNGACLKCCFGKSKEQVQGLLSIKEKSKQEQLVIEIETTWVDKENQNITVTVKQVSGGRVWFIIRDKKDMNEGKGGLSEAEFLNTYEPLKTLIDIEIEKDSDKIEVSRRWVNRDTGEDEISIFCANFTVNTIWFDCKNGGGRSDVSVIEFLTTYKPKPSGNVKNTPSQTSVTSEVRRESHYYYVTYDLKRYGRKGSSKGRVFVCFDSQSEFSVLETEKIIKQMLKKQKIKHKDLVVSNWKTISKDEFERAH